MKARHIAQRCGYAMALLTGLASISEAGGTQGPAFSMAPQLLRQRSIHPGSGGLTPSLSAVSYAFETVDAPDKLDDFFQITWINTAGQITQQYFFKGEDPTLGFGHTAVLVGDTWSLIDVPGSFTSGGTNANALGQVALSYADTDLVLHLALWRAGQYTYVPELPGYAFGGAQGINERGQVSAVYFDSNGVGLGFVGTSTNHVLFAYPGDVLLTIPFMTSNLGATVGFSIAADGSLHAFQYRRGQFTNLDLPGATFTTANGINDQGTIVGGYGDDSFAFHGYLLEGGLLSEIVVPDSQQVIPYMITNNNLISGTYQHVDGSWHGFVGYPVGGP